MLKSTLSAVILLAAAGICAPPAFAAPPEASQPVEANIPADPDYAAGKQAVEVKDWKAAVEAFGKAVEKNPGNANAHTMLAYSYRRAGNLDLAFKHYDEALRLDPKSRAAHEYVGEAYLMAGKLEKAEEHLKALDGLCFFGCEEYSDLKKAIAEFRQKSAAK